MGLPGLSVLDASHNSIKAMPFGQQQVLPQGPAHAAHAAEQAAAAQQQQQQQQQQAAAALAVLNLSFNKLTELPQDLGKHPAEAGEAAAPWGSCGFDAEGKGRLCWRWRGPLTALPRRRHHLPLAAAAVPGQQPAGRPARQPGRPAAGGRVCERQPLWARAAGAAQAGADAQAVAGCLPPARAAGRPGGAGRAQVRPFCCVLAGRHSMTLCNSKMQSQVLPAAQPAGACEGGCEQVGPSFQRRPGPPPVPLAPAGSWTSASTRSSSCRRGCRRCGSWRRSG
jgi:hypothetical protein